MKKLKVTINNTTYLVTVEEAQESMLQATEPQSATTRPESASGKPESAAARPASSRPSIVSLPVKPAAAAVVGGSNIVAPMPGVILAVKVKEGDAVKNGDVVAVLEAMKMENEISAKKGGVVKEIKVQAGQTVGAGEVLVVLG